MQPSASPFVLQREQECNPFFLIVGYAPSRTPRRAAFPVHLPVRLGTGSRARTFPKHLLCPHSDSQKPKKSAGCHDAGSTMISRNNKNRHVFKFLELQSTKRDSNTTADLHHSLARRCPKPWQAPTGQLCFVSPTAICKTHTDAHTHTAPAQSLHYLNTFLQ